MTDFIKIAQIMCFFKTGEWPSAASLVSEIFGTKKESANVTYWNYRHGRRSLKIEEAKKLATLTGLPAAVLINPEGFDIADVVSRKIRE